MAEITGPTRQDTYDIEVQIENPKAPGKMINYATWDKMTGGEVDSEQTTYYPGAMGAPVSLGGRRTVGNVTVSRLYRVSRDHTKAQQMIDSVGKCAMWVFKQPLNITGQNPGHPIVYKGTLKRVTFPEVDSEASGAGILELEMVVEGFPTS